MKVFVFWTSVVVLSLAASGVARVADKRKGAASKGRAVYTANCARCHGGDGMGHTNMGEIMQAPDLTDAGWQGRRSAARMIASVTNGRGAMPAFKKKLSKSDIAAAVAYVRTLKR